MEILQRKKTYESCSAILMPYYEEKYSGKITASSGGQVEIMVSWQSGDPDSTCAVNNFFFLFFVFIVFFCKYPFIRQTK